MNEKNEQVPSTIANTPTIWSILTISLASFALIQARNYRAALLFYKKTGGGGLNIFKNLPDGQSKRFFAIDYHPIWNKESKVYEWRLHYHRGDNTKEMKKHRPYDSI
jgi:hypothetical protein